MNETFVITRIRVGECDAPFMCFRLFSFDEFGGALCRHLTRALSDVYTRVPVSRALSSTVGAEGVYAYPAV